MRTMFVAVAALLAACGDDDSTDSLGPCNTDDGQCIFRNDTFGDEQLWTDTLRLHELVQTLPPTTALAVGLKVDADAVPADVLASADLSNPATTVALIQLGAVVGVRGEVENGTIKRIGITCALCHSTVDNSVTAGVGKRLDGWPNRDLKVGAIVSLAPNLTPIEGVLGADEATVRKVLASWGPGKFDAELFMDGKAFRPDGGSAATLIPPAFGLQGVNLHTYTGWGSIPYWNAFVAILEMHGQGDFTDARLDDPVQFPVAAKNHFGHVRVAHDRVTSKLPALQAYQLSLKAPTPPKRSYDAAAAKRGEKIFDGQGKCASCHVPPTYTEGGYNIHAPAEICTDSFQADRSPAHGYRTTPLKGLFAHAKHGFYHDGRYQTLGAVVSHYNSCMNLGLSAGQQSDLVQYLKSL
jgi:hypothetical protein